MHIQLSSLQIDWLKHRDKKRDDSRDNERLARGIWENLEILKFHSCPRVLLNRANFIQNNLALDSCVHRPSANPQGQYSLMDSWGNKLIFLCLGSTIRLGLISISCDRDGITGKSGSRPALPSWLFILPLPLPTQIPHSRHLPFLRQQSDWLIEDCFQAQPTISGDLRA